MVVRVVVFVNWIKVSLLVVLVVCSLPLLLLGPLVTVLPILLVLILVLLLLLPVTCVPLQVVFQEPHSTGAKPVLLSAPVCCIVVLLIPLKVI